MAKRSGVVPTGKKRDGSGGSIGGTKLKHVGVKGSIKGKNSGGTNPAGGRQIGGASHDGSSSGKRNSG